MHIVDPVTLRGAEICLEPLSRSHFPDLCAVGLDEEIWRWMPVMARNVQELVAWCEQALEEHRQGKGLPWAIIHSASGKAIGTSRFANIEATHRRLEIGWTWIGRPWQRTRVNTESKYLMLRHAFEVLSLVRVEFKTDALNERSRNALLRIGAKEEGTFRRHMTTSTGRIRDTVYFSIIDSDWPAVKTALQARLGD